MLGLLKRINFVHCANNVLLITSNNCIRNNFLQLRAIKLAVTCKNDVEETTVKKKKKTVRIPEITLMNIDGSITVTKLEQAEKLAKRHNFYLIKLPYIDTKGSRHIYKLVDHATYIREIGTSEKDKNKETNQNGKKDHKYKSTKLFEISSKINKHDLDTKLNNINKLLNKDHIVKIIFTYSENHKNKEEVLQDIKKNIQGVMEGEKILETCTRFTYLPLKAENEKSESDNKESDTKKI
ncbi:uncharacterized protein LOC117605100 [Osmia lignaria lignaria]|uniref:uncharacterized protein LOC117605100 n=1 Tax=Osmia lignaria lignaria TaxID=1437193 RepID=UPI001479485A|nr:translation initiation factor IF-3-like [Osmia lignaria]